MSSTTSTDGSALAGGETRGDAPAPWMPIPPLAPLLCFLLSLAMHLPWLGVTPIAGTEGHRIFPAHEMVVSHNWLVPVLFGQPFMTKPPLHQWLIAISETVAGTGRADVLARPTQRDLFAWRLPSALTGAALCAAACFFGARWFGRAAGLISGMCAVGMIAIWGQSQVADIDSTNTLAAALTAFCGIELFVASSWSSSSPRWIWVAAASLAMAATWMVKGPAGLPIILGVWIWAAVLAWREKRRGDLISAKFWLPIVLGLAVFVAWGLLATQSLRRHGLSADLRGVQEGSKLLIGKSIGVFATSLFVMLPQLIAFGLPMSAALLFLLNREVRGQMETRSRRIAVALAAAVLISWAICFISGMVNPRYGYPTLLPLCPLAGAVAVAAVRTPRTAAWLRALAIASCIALALAAAGLVAGLGWAMHSEEKSTALDRVINPSHSILNLSIGFALLAAVTAAWTVLQLRRSWQGAWGMVALLVLTSVPFGAQRQWSRTFRDSGFRIAGRLRLIVGENAVVAVGGAVTSKPETFTYAGVRVVYYSERLFLPTKVPPRTWVVLDQAERKQWLKAPVAQLEEEQWLCRNGKTDYYVAWFAGLQRPVASAPAAGR
jgi:4-amino-4-deoxy-L-arabinose transferase-like glycosyltransferase